MGRIIPPLEFECFSRGLCQLPLLCTGMAHGGKLKTNICVNQMSVIYSNCNVFSQPAPPLN